MLDIQRTCDIHVLCFTRGTVKSVNRVYNRHYTSSSGGSGSGSGNDGGDCSGSGSVGGGCDGGSGSCSDGVYI